jgi:hypothetical protein
MVGGGFHGALGLLRAEAHGEEEDDADDGDDGFFHRQDGSGAFVGVPFSAFCERALFGYFWDGFGGGLAEEGEAELIHFDAFGLA